MRIFNTTILILAALATSACSSNKAGLFGANSILANGDLAAAEPLFAEHEQECIGSADRLLKLVQHNGDFTKDAKFKECREIWTIINNLVSGDHDSPVDPATADQFVAQAKATAKSALTTYLANNNPINKTAYQSALGALIDVRKSVNKTVPSKMVNYSQVERDVIVDGLIASSNMKCKNYVSLIKNTDGALNAGLSVGAIITGGLGTVLGGVNTARALSGASSILSGSRSAINETYVSNQTIHVLTAAFTNRRDKQRQKMVNRQACSIEKYSVMRGLEDAYNYHSSCSIVAGLEEAALTVERSRNPGMEELGRQMFLLANVREQAQAIGTDTPPLAFQSVEAANLDNLTEANTNLKTGVSDLDILETALSGLKSSGAAQQAIDDKQAEFLAQKTKNQALSNYYGEIKRKFAGTISFASANLVPETRTCPF